MVLEVADDSVHFDAVVLAGDRDGRAPECLLAHVEGNEATQRSRVRERVEQQACLLRRARTELDERVGTGTGRDLAGAFREDAPLRSCRVVLGQPRDLVEELAAALVVEPFGRERLRCGRQAGAHVGLERAHHLVGFEMDVDANLGSHERVALQRRDRGHRVVGSRLRRATSEPSGTSHQPVSSSSGSDTTVASRTNSELPYRVAASSCPSVSSMLRRPLVIAGDIARRLSASAAPAVSPASSRSSARANSTSESESPSMPARRFGAHLGAQLVVDAFAEAADRTIEREEPWARHEGRVAARVDGGSRRRETRGADERAALDGLRGVGELIVVPDRGDRPVPAGFLAPFANHPTPQPSGLVSPDVWCCGVRAWSQSECGACRTTARGA